MHELNMPHFVDCIYFEFGNIYEFKTFGPESCSKE